MCGVFAVVSRKKLNRDFCKKISSLQFNRGPDVQKYNFFDNDKIFISNSILSITGKITKNKNLISSKNNNLYISFNGQIYNYKELADKYFYNYKKFINNDTEFLANIHEKFNFNIQKEFNGMYAYILYDNKRKTIKIINDPQGEKNLYYYFAKDLFIVSSTIIAITKYLGSYKINKDNIKNYFKTRHYNTYLNTSYENVYNFKNGTKAKFDLKKFKLSLGVYENPINWISKKTYRRLNKFSYSRILNLLRKKLETQAKLMIPSKKFGCIVTGGIDSTLQNMFLSKFKKSNYNLVIDHGALKDPSMKNILKFNKYLNPSIHRISCGIKFYKKNLIKLYKKHKHPMFAHDVVGRDLISKYLKRNNVKVMFTADGVDELFGGYNLNFNKFIKLKIYNKNASQYSGVIKKKITFTNFNNKDLDNKLEDLWKIVFAKYSFLKNKREASIQASLFTDYFFNSVYSSNRSSDLIVSENSVESRNIYIQKDIIKFVLNLPLKYKINFLEKKTNFQQKFILKDIFKNSFEEKLIQKKQGFPGFPNCFSKNDVNIFKKLIFDRIGPFFFKNNIKKTINIKKIDRDLEWKLINVGLFLKNL
jgi:asparagine synthase (glutamine-hydrolysing)